MFIPTFQSQFQLSDKKTRKNLIINRNWHPPFPHEYDKNNRTLFVSWSACRGGVQVPVWGPRCPRCSRSSRRTRCRRALCSRCPCLSLNPAENAGFGEIFDDRFEIHQWPRRSENRRYKFLMGFSVILRQIRWGRRSKVFFAWGNNSVCGIWISCSSWLTVRFSAFQCFQIQWSVGLLVPSRVQGAKELELVAFFIWAAEHLRAGSRGEPAVDWNGTGGYSQGSIPLSQPHFSLFWVSIFFLCVPTHFSSL